MTYRLDDTLAQLVHNTLLDCCTPECGQCGLDVDIPVVVKTGDELHLFCSEECMTTFMSPVAAMKGP